MQNVMLSLLEIFRESILKAFPTLDFPSDEIEISPSTQAKFGDYQCNSAMRLAKGLQIPPRKVAEAIVAQLDSSIFSKIEIAGPGFINLTLSSHYLNGALKQMLLEPRLGIPNPQHPQRIIIDFSAPNTAKEMHVGHLRSTIIGDCLARLFEFLGYEVIRHNHIGDWGTAFGMLIAYMKETVPEVLKGHSPTDLTHLVQWYRQSKVRFDADPEFKKRSQLEVVQLQSGNEQSLQAWEIICDISRQSYQEIYALLDVRLIERGESYYNPMLADVVAELESKGLVEVSEGAKCIFLEGFQNREGNILPLMIQKSDGGYNYDTTDMATIKHRIQVEHADRLIYVTDAGQQTHFQMIFQAAQKAGYLDPMKVRVDHVPFGLVLGNDGKKFRTRSGETERLIDLLKEAVDRAQAILLERSPEMPEEDRKILASALGINAVKYADLSCHRLSNYVFSYDKMLRFEGNTAAFLMYAYVRIAGIKRRIGIDVDTIVKTGSILVEHPSEHALAVHLIRFQETLQLVAQDLLPNRLTDYLYGLAETFNAFFRDCRVEGTPQQESRLLLCEVSAQVLQQGLIILGLTPVEKM